LLCSDGLHGYLDDEEIPYIMASGIEEAGRKFVELACDRGGKDNITAVIVEAYSPEGAEPAQVTELEVGSDLE
jgi:PPM family protein phosphatase